MRAGPHGGVTPSIIGPTESIPVPRAASRSGSVPADQPAAAGKSGRAGQQRRRRQGGPRDRGLCGGLRERAGSIASGLPYAWGGKRPEEDCEKRSGESENSSGSRPLRRLCPPPRHSPPGDCSATAPHGSNDTEAADTGLRAATALRRRNLTLLTHLTLITSTRRASD